MKKARLEEQRTPLYEVQRIQVERERVEKKGSKRKCEDGSFDDRCEFRTRRGSIA